MIPKLDQPFGLRFTHDQFKKARKLAENENMYFGAWIRSLVQKEIVESEKNDVSKAR